MAPFALLLTLIFSAWLVVRDCRRRRSVSAAVWIPTFLVLILSSRPLSLWLSGGSVTWGEMGNEAATNTIDQSFFLFVLAGCFIISIRRPIKWARLFTANTAIVIFYVFFAVSVLWSGDPLGSIKRLTKDFGLIFVIAVIFTEKDPFQAMRAVFLRAAYILIPLSVVFVKYYPNYARAFDIAGDIMYTGVTTQKNSLGEIILIFVLFLVWDYAESIPAEGKLRWSRIPWGRIILLIMCAWLLQLSQSKTALVCTLVGVFLIVRSGWLVSRTINKTVLLGALSLPFLMFFSQKFSSVIAPVVEALGRNMTFTGRTNIWNHINSTTVNPLIGAGYWNFWGGRGGAAISHAMDTLVPNAHCGYVDIYLDGGLIGLVVLFGVLVACGRRMATNLEIKHDANRFRRVRFAFFVVAIIYNLSESSFARMGPLWFTTLLMIVNFPLPKTTLRKSTPMPLNAEPVQVSTHFA